MVPPLFADLNITSASLGNQLNCHRTITCAPPVTAYSEMFSVKLQDVFTVNAFMRLSSTGCFLYGCTVRYLFFSTLFISIACILTDLLLFVKTESRHFQNLIVFVAISSTKKRSCSTNSIVGLNWRIKSII